MLSLSNVVVSLPYNTYAINFGSIINPFYTPNLPYLYKAGPCSGNSVYSGSSCKSYNCSVLNCQNCGVIKYYCDNCSSGYLLNNNQCSLASNLSNFSNSTNSTGPSNSTNSTNNNSTDTNNTNAGVINDYHSEMSPFNQMLHF